MKRYLTNVGKHFLHCLKLCHWGQGLNLIGVRPQLLCEIHMGKKALLFLHSLCNYSTMHQDPRFSSNLQFLKYMCTHILEPLILHY